MCYGPEGPIRARLLERKCPKFKSAKKLKNNLISRAFLALSTITTIYWVMALVVGNASLLGLPSDLKIEWLGFTSRHSIQIRVAYSMVVMFVTFVLGHILNPETKEQRNHF